MIRILILCFCLLQVQDPPVIEWSPSYKLQWSDFQGKSNHRTSAAAVTASGISFGFSVKYSGSRVVDFSTEVHAHFYIEESWYRPEKANSHILKHEQLHFDITELHVRKLRQRISRLKVSNTIKAELRKLQNEVNAELKIMQDSYDKETSHSRNFEVQAKWDVFIAEELKTYSKFKSN